VVGALRKQHLFQDENELGLREIARRVNLSVAVVHRIVVALAHHRFLRQVPETRRYVLGGSLFELAQRFREEDRFAQECVLAMDELRDQTGETVAMHVVREGLRVNVLESRSQQVLRQVASPGAYMTLTHGAVDIAAYAVATEAEREQIVEERAKAGTKDRLPNKRELAHFMRNGWSFSHGARTAGASGIAVVVPHHEVRLVLAVHGPHQRIESADIEHLAEQALTTASILRDRIDPLHASL